MNLDLDGNKLMLWRVVSGGKGENDCRIKM